MWRFCDIPGTYFIPKTLENHILMQLCAQKNFIIAELYAKRRAVKNAEITLPILSFFSLWFYISAPFNMCKKICYSDIIEANMNSN